MVAALKFGKDSQGLNSYAPKPSTLKYKVELTNGTPADTTLPIDADFYTVNFRIQPGCSVWINVLGGTAEFPVLNTITETDSELNPATLVLAGGTVISMISPNAVAQVGICCWQGGGS